MKYLLHILLGLNLLVTTLVYVQTTSQMDDLEWTLDIVQEVVADNQTTLRNLDYKIGDIQDRADIY